MFLKERKESEELQIFRSLNARMELTEKEKYHCSNLEKGYEGEVKFDQLIKDHQEEKYVIPDLLLKVNNSYFQIDTVILAQDIIHLIDVKNYQGDFYLDADKLFLVNNRREVKNPLNQLKRSDTLFCQLLQNLKLNFLVKSSIFFINPEFTLYQAPIDNHVILPTQTNRFIDSLNKAPSSLSERHKELAQKLLAIHQSKNPYTEFPDYNYDQLKKGVTCAKCHSFKLSIDGRRCVCQNCGHAQLYTLAVIRCIEEYKLLFPERKITTPNISEWCKVDLSSKSISRILKKNYTKYGSTYGTFYKTTNP